MTKLQEQLAKNMRFYRSQKGLTQEGLAERAGTATNYIGTIEIGKKFPSPKMIEKIASALEIDELCLFAENIQNLSRSDIEKIERALLKNITKTVKETFRELKK